jgi:hypothetical protein
MEYGAFSKSVASRVNPREYGIDPATIILILTEVLPMIMDCFMPMNQSDQDVITRVKTLHRVNPRRLRRRLAAGIRRETPQPISYRLAYKLADETIQECLAHDDKFVYGSDDVAVDDDDQHDGTAGGAD